MGNASASQKGRSSNAPRAAKDLQDLLPALRERFEELSGLPAAAAASAVAAAGETEERYVMFDDWSELPGPRGKQLAQRLYSVLDADGDGRLDFEVGRSSVRAFLLRATATAGAVFCSEADRKIDKTRSKRKVEREGRIDMETQRNADIDSVTPKRSSLGNRKGRYRVHTARARGDTGTVPGNRTVDRAVLRTT